MKGKNDQRQPPPSPSAVEDDAAGGLKKRLQDWELIVNAGAVKSAEPTGKKKGRKQ